MSDDVVRVLVVGGTPKERENYKKTLDEAPEFDYVVREADTGKEGLEAEASENPDCIILDADLPDMAPTDFLDGLADTTGQISTSVIAVVPKGKKSIAQAVMDGGTLDFIMKDQLDDLLLARSVRYAVELTWTERNLEELRILLKTILTAIPGYLAIKNRDLLYQAMNPAFCRLVGKGPDEIMAKSDEDLFPEDEAAAFKDADQDVMESGVMRTDEVEVTGAERQHELQVSRSPIVDADGVTAGVLLTAREIPRVKTELEEEEAGGVAAEEEAAEEAAPELVFDFLPSYRLTLVNDEFADFFGKTNDELIGQSLRNLIPKDEHDQLNKNLAVLVYDRPEGIYRHGAIAADGETHELEWTFTAQFNTKRRLESYHGVAKKAPPQTEEMKECPECAEKVRAKAKKCRFCGHAFEQ